MEVEEEEKEGGEEYVISELSKFIEQKCHAVEYDILQKFEQFANQYDTDRKRQKEQLKLKFEKLTRHLDESVFTILSKGERCENDLDKVYKNMLKLLVAPNHQNNANTKFLRGQKCKTPLKISDYTPPKCNCRKRQLPCEYLKTPVAICPPKKPMKERRSLDCDKSGENVRYTWLTPQRKHILDKPTCSPGNNQSPIEISEAIPVKMPAIEMIGYRNLRPGPIILRNNNCTVELTAGTLTENEMKLGDFIPYITGGTAESHRFGYARPEQRRKWGKLHRGCAGKYQSPIAISCNKAVPLNMPAIDMTGYRNLLPAPIKLINNGYTISMSMGTLTQKEKNLGDFLPFVSGGKLEGIYEVNTLHFHWGDKNNRGAEHILNDIRYAMEMHIVHKNTKYKDVPEAMTYSDGLAVMAFFFEMSEYDGPELNGFVKNLPSLKNANDAVELGTTFSLHSLISCVDLDRFYTYKGSLTTPPYSEAVTWVIFPDPLKISLSQLSKFRHLHSSEEYSPLVDNFRNVQPIGNRRIFLRRVNTQNQSLDELDEVHYSKWGWFV